MCQILKWTWMESGMHGRWAYFSSLNHLASQTRSFVRGDFLFQWILLMFSVFLFQGYCKVALHWWSSPSCGGQKDWTHANGIVRESKSICDVCFALVHVHAPEYELGGCASSRGDINVAIFCRRRKQGETVWCLTCFLCYHLILLLRVYIYLIITVNNLRTKNELKSKNVLILSWGVYLQHFNYVSVSVNFEMHGILMFCWFHFKKLTSLSLAWNCWYKSWLTWHYYMI